MEPYGQQHQFDPRMGDARTLNSRPAPSTPPPQTQSVTVEHALEMQMQAVNELHEHLSALESRLYSVLEQVPASDKAGAGEPAPSNLLERLFVLNRAIALASGRVCGLNQRLQL